MCARRPLHYVLKYAEREETMQFYTHVLGMIILRHEEFDEGCKATCNGPYAGKWSKTMIGYGPEEDHFVIELTYNYGVRKYDNGNDILYITIESTDVRNRVLKQNVPFTDHEDGSLVIRTPTSPGYIFHIKEGATSVSRVTLGCSNVQRTTEFWSTLLKMDLAESDANHVVLSYPSLPSFSMEFVRVGDQVEHKSAEGRIAFACPKNELLGIQDTVEKSGYPVKNRLVALETPGKATVEVVILLDPDMHEVCFVGDEAYRELSRIDPHASDLLHEVIKIDKSHLPFWKGSKAT